MGTASLTAVHLEMRDGYGTDPVFEAWQAGELDLTRPAYPGWYEEVRRHRARGVEFRRVRIVSEPVTDYIRFEYEITAANNAAAGEQVRWLPRRQASDLHLPGNDFWVFDDRAVRFGHFAGDGTYVGDEECDDLAVVQMCSWAFEAAWKRAVPHEEYDCPTG
ncbi:MAG: hypothetical protein GEV11_26915 [Streptosporangiales bacterium]|nr:hypothetical protein [Streptosporangiales bacterium]